MARHFKAEEEELDAWFDEEKKEKLTKQHLKKIDKIRRKQEEEDEEEKKPKEEKKLSEKEQEDAVKQIESEFLVSMRKIRQNYQKRYDKIKTAKDNFDRNKKTKAAVGKPVMGVLGYVWGVLKKVFLGIWKVIRTVFGFIGKGVGGFFGRTTYNSKEYYTFHMKSKVMPAYRPVKKFVRFFTRPIGKGYDKTNEARKRLFKNISATFSKVLEIIVKYAKKLGEFITKYLKIVTDFTGKWMKKYKEFKEKNISPVVAPIFAVFKKKDKEE